MFYIRGDIKDLKIPKGHFVRGFFKLFYLFMEF